ncbi:hypothetical protein [Luteimonas vadosa]|uniref:DUF1579 domain-containing protein n=1 Tax=Luteimonas vadosa TaxID=1165507 RepID=A0ABP9DUR7_9GAMM
MTTFPYKNVLLGALLAAGLPLAVVAADQPDPHNPSPRIAAQRAAMAPLAKLDGHWRGTATIVLPSGETRTLVQTERVGSFLDGSIKVIEGRGYDAEGNIDFNAFAIVSFDPAKQAYNFRSYAHGRSGDFKFKPTDDGFQWEIPAGPATIRYTATIADGHWREVGERIVPGQAPVRMVTLDLQRIADSDWPAAGAVPKE